MKKKLRNVVLNSVGCIRLQIELKTIQILCFLTVSLLLVYAPVYSQCSCASPITTTTTIASGATGCISANSSVAITVNGTLLITGASTTVSNITLGSGGIVEICGTGNTITFNTIANTSQILIDPSGTGNTITQLNQSSGTLTLTNNLAGTNALTIGTATVNSVTLVSFSNSGSGNTFIHAGTGTTNMSGGIQGPGGNSFALNITGGSLNIGADGNSRSVDYTRSSGGSTDIINVAAGARLTTTGSLDFSGTNISTGGGLINLGTTVIGKNANGYSIEKQPNNNAIPFTNGSASNSTAILIMNGGMDIGVYPNGTNTVFNNYGSWSVGVDVTNGYSLNGNAANQTVNNFSTGTFVFAGGFNTGGGSPWNLNNNGVMSIGAIAVYGGKRNVSIFSGDALTINNGNTNTAAELTILGAALINTTSAWTINNYGCITARNIDVYNAGNSPTLNLYGGSSLNFTGANSLAVTANGSASTSVAWTSNTAVAIGDCINTSTGTWSYINNIASATAGTINNSTAVIAGPYNVYSLLANMDANSFTLNRASGLSNLQLAGAGVRTASKVTTSGSGTLNLYQNGTGSTITTPTSTFTTANTACGTKIIAANALSALNTCQGTASAPASIAVSGINMGAGILVTPPSGFEVCLTSSGTYTSTVTVGAAGSIAPTLVYVRLAAATSAGTYSGNIVLSSSGASNVNVATVSSVVASSATVALSSPSGDLAAASGNTCANSVNDPVFNFQLAVTVNPGILNQINFTTTGSHTATDITNYKLWYNASSNSLTGATQIGSTIITGTAAGTHSFTGLTQSMSVGTTGYFIITADIASGAVATHTIQVSQLLAANVIFQCSGTVSGSTTGAGGTQTVSSSALTVTPTCGLNPAYYGNSVTLSAGASGGSGSYTYSWSSVPAFFSGTSSTSTASITPVQNTIVTTVLVKDGYCVKSGSITETVSIPYQGTNIINNVSTANGLAVNLPSTTGYAIPGTIYTYNFNTGTATALNTGSLDYAETGNGGSNSYGRSGVATEANAGTGVVYNVANTASGEFLAYTVNIANAGTYNITYNVANGSGGSLSGQFKLQLDGVDIATTPSSITTLNNGWTTFTSYTVTATLSVTGIHTLKLVETAGNFNISTIVFACPASTATVLSPSSATICGGGTINLSAAITGGSSPFTLVYTDGTSNFTVNNYVSGTAIPVSPASTKTYSLVSVTGSCGVAGTGLSGTTAVTVSGVAPNVVLASPGSDIAAATANTCTGSTNDPIYNFQLSATTSAASVTQVNFTTTGTHTSSDITNYKLWYNATSNSLTGAVQVGSSITTSTGAGAHSFTGLTQSVAINTTGYFIITADIASGASVHTIQTTALTTGTITLSCFNTFTGTTTSGGSGTQTINGSLTVAPTSSLNPCYYGSSVTLSAGVTNGMGGTPKYSWSSVPTAFTGTSSTSASTLTVTASPVTATVVVTNGYCSVTGTLVQAVSIPYSAGATNPPLATGYSIPGSVYIYNYNTGTASAASATGSLDYNDGDGTNNGGQYRTGYGVDIESQSGGVDTYDIGWTNSGEWQAFTVNVATAGSYTVGYTVAAPNAGTGVKLQDVNMATNTATDIVNSEITGFNTGGNQNWTTIAATSPITLTAGIHTIRVYYETGNFNLTKVTFTCAASTAAVISGTGYTCSSGSTTNLSVAITGGSSPFTVVYTDGTSNFTLNNYVSGTAIPVAPTTNKTYTLVSVTGSCGATGTGLSGSAVITIANTPATPGSITGTIAQCPGATAQTYSVSPVTYATTYTWTVPTGWSVTAGAGTNSITVTAGTSGQNGNITVTAGNTCGTSLQQTLAVTVNAASAGGTAIAAGTGTICSGSTASLSLASNVGTAIQWQQSSDNSNWSNVSGGTGATTSNYTTAALNAGMYYRASVSNAGCAIAYSVSDTVTVNQSSTASGTAWTTAGYNDNTTGLGPWIFTASSGSAGFFTQSTTTDPTYTSPSIDKNSNAWGIYSNTGSLGEAKRVLTSFSIGNTITFSMQNGQVDNGNAVGFSLYNSSNVPLVEFFFKGGNTTYTLNDNAGQNATTINYTNSGLTISIAYTGSNTYGIEVTPLAGGAKYYATGTFKAQGNQIPTQVRFFNGNAGSGNTKNVYFNSLSLNGPAIVTPVSTTPQSSCGSGLSPALIGVGAYGSGITFQWYKNTTASKAGATPVSGATASSYTPSSSATTYYYYCVASSACLTDTSNVSGAIAVQPTSMWTGTSTNWNSSANWSCAAVPTSATNVEIPTTPSGGSYPVLTAAGSVNNLQLDNLSTLALAGNTFTVYGSITGTGKIKGSPTSSLVLNKAGTAGTITFAGSPDTLLNLTQGAKDTATIASSLFIAAGTNTTPGTLNVGDSATLNTSDSLTLSSDNNSTAIVTQIPENGSGIATGKIIGKVTVQRYAHSNVNVPNSSENGSYNTSVNNGLRAWRMMTAPVTTTGSPTIEAAWQNNGITYDVNNPATKGIGTLVTGPSAGNGLDAVSGVSLYAWSTTSNSFTPVSNTTTAISNGNYGGTNAGNTGYMLFIRGDRDPMSINNPNNGGITINNTMLNPTGNLITGRQVYAIQKSVSGAIKFTMVGNPYAAPINLETLINTNPDKKYYIWNPNLSTVGAFVSIDYISGSATYSPSVNRNVTAYVQSGQAFLVEGAIAGSNGTLQIDESMKANANNNYVFRPATAIESFATNLYFYDGSTANIADGTVAQYRDDFSADVDSKDVRKLTNLNENLAMLRDGKTLSVERRPIIVNADTLFFKLTQTTSRNYQFQFTATALDHPGLQGFLKDSYTGDSTQLSLNGNTSVDFSVDTTIAGSKAPDRFMVVFAGGSTPLPVTFTSIKAVQQNNGSIAVNWNVQNEINIASYEVEKSTDDKTFSSIGNIIAKGQSHYSFEDVNAIAGSNYYRVRSIGINGTTQYSTIAKVDISDIISAITVYPNPVLNGQVSVQFANIPMGLYRLRLINVNGQTVYFTTINNAVGSNKQKVNLPAALAAGIYKLELVSPDKVVYVKDLIVD